MNEQEVKDRIRRIRAKWSNGVSDFAADVHFLLDVIDAATPPPGHVIDDAGNVRKVLGTLPLTADGCVIGHKAWLWNIMPGAKGRDDDRPMRVCYMPAPIMDPDAYTDGPKRMYSTAEAAEAARKEGQP